MRMALAESQRRDKTFCRVFAFAITNVALGISLTGLVVLSYQQRVVQKAELQLRAQSLIEAVDEHQTDRLSPSHQQNKRT